MGATPTEKTQGRRYCVVFCRLVACAAALAASTVIAQESLSVIPGVDSSVPPGAPSAVAAAPASPAGLNPIPATIPHTPAAKPLPQQISAMPSVSEALEVVHHRSQLIVTRSKVVRTAVADPSVIDVVQYSPNELSIIGAELGSTTLTLWFQNSPEPLIYLVTTTRDPGADERRKLDLAKLEKKLAVLFPDSKVYLIPFSGKTVVKGQARDTEEAARILQIVRGEVSSELANSPEPQDPSAGSTVVRPQQAGTSRETAASDIVNMLRVPGELQVMLRVRIAELNRTLLRSKGIHLDQALFDGQHSEHYFAGASSGTVAGVFENREINHTLHALASSGTAKILSEPVLTVMSGNAASFLSGGEFAVPTIVGVEGVGAQQTTFHGFGTSLKVTPFVLDKDLIRMVIAPEFSQLNPENTVNGIPGIDTRRAQTTVQLREGQTIALAGLIAHRTTAESSRLPLLGSIPMLGRKFFSGKTSQDETELLILVTPEIVRPMDADEVPPVPGHDVTHPSDCEFYRCGMTEGTPDPAVYQAGPYGSGHSAGVPVGYRFSATAPGAPPPTVSPYTLGVSPLPTGYGPLGEMRRPSGAQTNRGLAQHERRFPRPRRPSNDPSIVSSKPKDSLNRGAIQQTVASFESGDQTAPPKKPTNNTPTNNTPSTTRWYQRPFRSFDQSESAPQRPADVLPANGAQP
jgi:pilus assembly protein CpaC